MLSRRDFPHRRKFRTAYWWIFKTEDLREARERFEAFLRQWRKEPQVLRALRTSEGSIFEYLRLTYWWRPRVRTTKEGENFFRHLRTFLGRFPGFKDEGHLECAFAAYLLSHLGGYISSPSLGHEAIRGTSHNHRSQASKGYSIHAFTPPLPQGP